MKYLLHHLLEGSAAEDPESVAVVDGPRRFTYAELDEHANRLANVLLELGVERGERVGLYIDKSFEAVAGIYGVLKAGCAYVPLDPQAPVSRLAYIARDAGVRVLLTGFEKQESWPGLSAENPSLETLIVLNHHEAIAGPEGAAILSGPDLVRADSAQPAVSVVDGDLAYILYTSGSTGSPKGVMLTHRNGLAFVEWATEEFRVGPADVLSSHAPLHFDLSTFDLFAAANAGASLVLVPAAVSVFPASVRRFIDEQAITIWYSVPSILTMLVLRGGLAQGEFPNLRTILFAGEVFPTKYLRELQRLLPHVRLVNLFGPTETNVCTWWDVSDLPDDQTEPIPIGKGIVNVDVFSVTDEGKPAAVGEVGELYVRGATVMQGYLGDSERTASRLVPHPFGGPSQQLVYRTGDIVQELEDGSYRFLGRRDSQVKSRGYRIELGDIEAALQAHPSIVDCAVLAVPDELVTNRISAHVVAGDNISKADLIVFLGDRIPHYMIPELFAFPAELPRTSTGKVDRRALATDAVVSTEPS